MWLWPFGEGEVKLWRLSNKAGARKRKKNNALCKQAIAQKHLMYRGNCVAEGQGTAQLQLIRGCLVFASKESGHVVPRCPRHQDWKQETEGSRQAQG